MAELCPTVADNDVLLDPEATVSIPPATSSLVLGNDTLPEDIPSTKHIPLKERNSPSPTETVCCINELSVPEDIDEGFITTEPVAGPSRPSNRDEILQDFEQLPAVYLNEEQEVRDDIDVLLDNTLNETHERILQDNRTPERLINRSTFEEDDEDNILNNLVKRVSNISGGSSSTQASNNCANNQVFRKNNLFSGLKNQFFNDVEEEEEEECISGEENDSDNKVAQEDEDDDDESVDRNSWLDEEAIEADDEDDDALFFHDAMEEVRVLAGNPVQESVNEAVVLANGEEEDGDETEDGMDDEEEEECSSTMEVAEPKDNAGVGDHCPRSWRKRKLEPQSPFPSKKIFPDINKTEPLMNENQADGDSLTHTLQKLKTICGATSTKTSTLAEKKPRLVIPTKDNPPPEMPGWLSQFQRWSNAERLLAIDELIDKCEPTQVRHMMQVIEPQFQRDFISLLPHELALNVLRFLEPKDLLTAAQTCRSWRDLAEDNLLWREKCRQTGINELPSVNNLDDLERPIIKKRSKHYHHHHHHHQRNSNSHTCGVQHSSPWKAAYMRQHAIEMNWRIKPIRPPKVLKGHDDHVITCLQFCGNRIVSGSDDNTLKVWSAVSGKCLRTLIGHTGGVWSSQMAGSVIISGSTDRTLKIWNADSGVCIHTLYGHTSTVRCMHLHENRVVSGSRDATLRMWDIVTGECLHVLVGHLAAVRCVQYDGRLVVSGAYDYMVKVWNPEREECLHTLQGHTNRVYSLQFDGVHVVSGSLDTSIRVWEVETGACRHTLMGHQSLTSGMELRNNILVSGNADSTVKVWDILTGQCLQTLSGANKHQSAVTCLQFNNRFVITSSDDGTVKLWDVRTGAFIRDLVALDSGGSGGVVWRIRANDTKLVCAVGSRNGTEETKLLVLDFDVECCQSATQPLTLTNLNSVITATIDTTDR